MKTKKNKKALLKKAEKKGWKKLNQQKPLSAMTPEQCLDWLDSVRGLMFEVWKKNPSLRKSYEKSRQMGL